MSFKFSINDSIWEITEVASNDSMLLEEGNVSSK